ncbi:MAG: hypothetical protein IJ989_04505 [Paludibacteraceae bacterium]|nr:hypothetical protein [Paludibacteraceae bacterium]
MKRIFTFIWVALFAIASFAASQTVAPQSTAQATSQLDTTELFFPFFWDDPIYYEKGTDRSGNPTGGDWYFTLKNDRYQFVFDLYGGNESNMAGHYTEANLGKTEDEITYSWASLPGYPGKSHYYKKLDLTIKYEKVSKNMTSYTVEALIVTTLGIDGPETGIFKIEAEHAIITPAVVIETAFLDAKITLNKDGFNFNAKNEDAELLMDIITTEGVGGAIGLPHINPSTFQIKNPKTNKTYNKAMRMSAYIEENELTDANHTPCYAGFIEIYTTDTTFFNIVFQAPIYATDTVDITCYNLVTSLSKPSGISVVATGDNRDYEIQVDYMDSSIKPGTYGRDSTEVQIIEKATGKTITSIAANVKVEGSKTAGYTITTTALCSDHQFYNIVLTDIIPDMNDTIDIQFATSSKAMFDIDELGLYELQMANSNDDYSIALDILNIDRILISEAFETSDLLIDETVMATYLVKHAAEGDENIEIYKVSGSIKQERDTTFLNATITGADKVLYQVSMFYTVPTPTDTISYTFNENNTFFTNALPQGIFILEGMTDDGQAMCNIQVNRITTGSPEGTFICDGKFEENQFEPFETYVSILKDPAKQEYEKHYMQKGEMTVTIDKEKLLVVATASFICDDAILYQLSLTAPYEIPHLPEDAEDEGASYTFGRNTEVFVMDDYLESDGYIEYILYVENPFNMLDLIFFIDETDPDIIIPEGVYPFGAYGSKNHVLASRGMAQDSQTGEIYPLPSYYQTLDELSQPYGYFLVAGQVTVEKVDGHIVLNVDAINSNYLPVKILYDPSITAVENIETDSVTSVQKQIINGQLFIIRNGETFSITGMRVK